LVWPISALAEAHQNPASTEAVELTPSPFGATIDLQRPTRDEDAIRSLELEVGKVVVVRTAFQVKRVSVGDPKILEVVVLSPREIQLVPASIGETNLVLWDPAGAPQAAIDVHVGAPTRASAAPQASAPTIHVESAGRQWC
jgi:Flp pilus assembly secretin CpaC